MKFQKSPHWTLLRENCQLIATKGADEIYLLDGVDDKTASLIYESYKSDSFDSLNLNEKNINQVISKLEKSGVIYKRMPEKPKIAFSLIWAGNKVRRIESLLRQFTVGNLRLNQSEEESKSDLIIIIRTSKKMSEILKDYGKIKYPHLFIDIAYSHTISLGPLVFPGDTACLGCYAGRVMHNWGDAEPPKSPEMNGSAELISALILEQLKNFHLLGSCPEMVENAISFNLKELTIKSDSVYRLPWCKFCFPKQEFDNPPFDGLF